MYLAPQLDVHISPSMLAMRDGNVYRTLVVSLGRRKWNIFRAAKLATRTVAGWNQIVQWLRGSATRSALPPAAGAAGGGVIEARLSLPMCGCRDGPLQFNGAPEGHRAVSRLYRDQ